MYFDSVLLWYVDSGDNTAEQVGEKPPDQDDDLQDDSKQKPPEQAEASEEPVSEIIYCGKTNGLV